MCGIAGIVTGHDVPDLALVRSMVAALDHRGPDGVGFYRDRHAALGHARLSIIDIAGGAQPMATSDGSVWVSFNGEIFNYLELADELRSLGHTFATRSDTDVILHAWQQWGRGAFERLNGQWAVAIWEPANRRLVLCRDRLGIRPLYYARLGHDLLFASEVKALLRHPHLPRAFDPAGLAQVTTLWSALAPRTVFDGVAQVRPGHLLEVNEGRVEESPWWHLPFAAEETCDQDLATSAERLRAALEEATRLRFERSDVPVGAYLSGGIDSAVTASLVAQATEAPVQTFSLRFSDAAFDEGGYQREMATRLGTEHHEVTVAAGSIAEVFPDVVAHAESVLLRSAPAPMFLLSRLVSERGYRVVVTGEGADEMLAGYDIFREARLRQFWLRNPESAVRDGAVTHLYPWLARNPAAAPAFARTFFGRDLSAGDMALSHRTRWGATRALQGLFTQDLREHIATLPDPGAGVVDSMPAEAAEWDPLSRAQWLEATTLLPGYILSSQGDRMLMANSVEGRFPFLDPGVIEAACAMPARHRLLGLDEKHVLKRAFADLVPASILARPKQPYRAPDASAFFGLESTPGWLEDCLSARALESVGVFDVDRVTGLIAKCRRRGGAEMSHTDDQRILAVISTQLLAATLLAGTASATHTPHHPHELVIDRLAQEGMTA